MPYNICTYFLNHKLSIPTLALFIVGIFSFSALAETSTTDISAPVIENSLRKHSLGIGLGQTFLDNDFSENGTNKITFDLFYEYSASYSFDFLAGAHYSEHENLDRKVQLGGFTGSIKGKFFQFDNFAPYGTMGVGFYHPQVTRRYNGRLIKSESKFTFGWNLGLGSDLKLNNHFKVGLMAILHNPFDIQQANAPDVEGSYYKMLFTTFYTF